MARRTVAVARLACRAGELAPAAVVAETSVRRGAPQVSDPVYALRIRVRRVCNNVLGTGLGTAATRLGARAPCSPARFDNAVNRACLCVARGVLLLSVAERACFAVVVLRCCDSVRARLRASSTGFGARTEARPRPHTVHWILARMITLAESRQLVKCTIGVLKRLAPAEVVRGVNCTLARSSTV